MGNTPTDSAPTWTPGARELADLELLLLGAYPSLPGFLNEADVESVRAKGRLADGTPWPVPVTLELPEDVPASDRVVLQDPEGVPLATLEITDLAAGEVGVQVAGTVTLLNSPEHGPFRRLRRPAADVRKGLPSGPVLGVVLRHPPNRRDLAEMRWASQQLGAHVLMFPLLSGQHPGAVVRSALAVCDETGERGATVVPVPLAEPDDPDREFLLHAHVAAAYGATHLLAKGDRDDAPIPLIVPPAMAYNTADDTWLPAEDIPAKHRRAGLDDSELTALLDAGEPLPEWFVPPDVAGELRAARPPRSARGLTVFFTGLSGSGKSTVARGLHDVLLERGGRTVTLLDGDIVRRLLSYELTFSRADRDLNIRRIGYVAAEVSRHGGVAICAPIAPYAETRAEVRRMVSEVGDFVLVHVATPLEVCEQRDRKGLYAKARAGQIESFTGISDPYEEPDDAELVLDTSKMSVDEAVSKVLDALVEGGWVPGSHQTD
ncbi:MAG: adenylyl-sulfate kinase [Streptosporangiales bacterium]|nr:adenylyl-sulfate kinase [Streptosporangiales bacterium]